MTQSIQKYMEDFYYEESLKFFWLAEEKRRWNVLGDIPWLETLPNPDPTIVKAVKLFLATEEYLPDFTSKLLRMIRKSRGRSWFHVNWGYEEAKHSMALELWLLQSGHWTEKDRKEFQDSILCREWDLPFDHPRQMLAYTSTQELATFWNYRQLERYAISLGADKVDQALVAALRKISVDERVHYNHYLTGLKEWAKIDPEGTMADVKFVFDNFTMPGDKQIPKEFYDDAAKTVSRNRIYGPREYIKLVRDPILVDLGLNKDFDFLEGRALRYQLKQAETIEMLRREQIVVPVNGEAIAKNNSPLNGNPNKTDLSAPLIKALAKHLEQSQLKEDQEPIIHRDKKPKLTGSRAMPNLTPLDQHIITLGDQASSQPR